MLAVLKLQFKNGRFLSFFLFSVTEVLVLKYQPVKKRCLRRGDWNCALTEFKFAFSR